MSLGRKRTFVRWLLLALCALSGLILWTVPRLPRPPANPIYRGKPLSQHLYNIYAPFPSQRLARPMSPQELAALQAELTAHETRRIDSSKALGGQAPFGFVPAQRLEIIVGPEALPLLTNWMATAPPTGWKFALGNRLSRFVDLPSLTRDHQMIAWHFLSEYPVLIDDPDLAIFFPGLTNSEPRIRGVAALALGRQVRAGMKVEKEKIIRALFPLSAYHMASDASVEYKRSFSYSGPVPSEQQVRSIIDAVDPTRDLIPLYTLEMGHIHARVGAAMELTDKPRYPARAIPLLITNLTSTNRSVQERCAQALAAYGTEALSALPSLTNLLQHPRERVRLAASNAIVSINAPSDSSASIQSP